MTNRQVSVCYMQIKTAFWKLVLQTEFAVLKLILQISGRLYMSVFTE